MLMPTKFKWGSALSFSTYETLKLAHTLKQPRSENQNDIQDYLN